MKTDKELMKSIEKYHDDLLKKARDWHKGQRVGLPQTVKEINAQLQGFEDGYAHAMSIPEGGDIYDNMKTIDEFIASIRFDESNLEYIGKSGKINGSLLASMRIVIRKAQEQAIDLYSKELLFTDTSILANADKAKGKLK